jgi:ATP-dependent DNA ligase
MLLSLSSAGAFPDRQGHQFSHPNPSKRRVSATEVSGDRAVGQLEFAEWTPDNHLRHSRFLGLREDKSPRDVVREDVIAADSES